MKKIIMQLRLPEELKKRIQKESIRAGLTMHAYIVTELWKSIEQTSKK